MNKIDEYVERYFEDIPDGERKTQLMQEILRDLREKVYDLTQSGKTQEDAENKAIVDFGDISDITKELKDDIDVPSPFITKRKTTALQLGYSVWGSILVITLVVFINFYYTPGIIWFVYPTFGILWWPLSMLFRWLKYR